ncbi:hypothetical protein ACOBV8_18440 (plasmid) [Pseudoalteromonas espejiana]
MKVLNALTITFIGALSIGCTSSVTPKIQIVPRLSLAHKWQTQRSH